MLPKTDNDGILMTFTEEKQPSKTYLLNQTKEVIRGTIDDIKALEQTIELILSIERYEYIIYSWNYGVETKDLIGEDYLYVCSELKRRIEEALVQDDRINSVDSFLFEENKNKVKVTFTVHSIFGDIVKDKEADV